VPNDIQVKGMFAVKILYNFEFGVKDN